MKNILRSTFLLTTCIFLISCRLVVKEYEEPTSTETATIEFIAEADKKMGVVFYEGYEQCTNRLGVGAVNKGEPKVVKILTGEPFVFTTNMDIESSNSLFAAGIAIGGMFGGLLVDSALEQGCQSTIEFTPKPGRYYIFRMFSDNNACSYQLFEKPLTKASSNTLKVNYKKRKWIRPFDEAGPFCEKDNS